MILDKLFNVRPEGVGCGMVTLIIGSQMLKAFCAVFGICARKNFIQRILR